MLSVAIHVKNDSVWWLQASYIADGCLLHQSTNDSIILCFVLVSSFSVRLHWNKAKPFPFKTCGGRACDLKPNQEDTSTCMLHVAHVAIATWASIRSCCLIQRFPRVISLYCSGQSIQLIQSAVPDETKNWWNQKKSPVFVASSICNDNSAITKQGFGDWWGLEVFIFAVFGLWLWVCFLFNETTDVCSSTKTVNSEGTAFGRSQLFKPSPKNLSKIVDIAWWPTDQWQQLIFGFTV